MAILQLNPTIPMITPRGNGYALFLINESDEHHIQWVVAQDDGTIWTWMNPDVRMQQNITMHRPKPGPITPQTLTNI
jgi:hypothetical protein